MHYILLFCIMYAQNIKTVTWTVGTMIGVWLTVPSIQGMCKQVKIPARSGLEQIRRLHLTITTTKTVNLIIIKWIFYLELMDEDQSGGQAKTRAPA